MRLKALVAGIEHATWFRDTRDERQVVILNCLDMESHEGLKLKQTFEYQPTQEEEKELELDKLDGGTIVLGVNAIVPGKAGRLTFKGKIDRSSIPKTALRGTASAQTPMAAVVK